MHLNKGDYVDIIAPSSGPLNTNWKQGLNILKSWGLKPCLFKHALDPWMYHSNTNTKRLQFLKQAFKNSNSQSVWALRGGYGLQKIMTAFSKAKIQQKLFIGFSDATALHLYLNQTYHWPSLHAPFIQDLPHVPLKQLNALKQILFGLKKEVLFPNLKCLNRKYKQNLKAILLGGNLTLLATSLSSVWCPKKLDSCFLFLEDINEEEYRVDRALHQLFFSGFMSKVKAIVLGSFTPLKNKNLENIFLKSFSQVSKIPIFQRLPCGHTLKNSPLPLGKPAEIQFKGDRATLRIKSL